MKVNVWKSTYTNEIYEMPIDWLPKFGGWQLIATIRKVETHSDNKKNKEKGVDKS